MNGVWLVLGLFAFGSAIAGEVEIVDVDAHREPGGGWAFAVTLRHADSGWDHYADRWRVVDAQGGVLGERRLAHPHVDEQPFTRALHGVAIPPGLEQVWIEAHDSLHGWSPQRARVSLMPPEAR